MRYVMNMAVVNVTADMGVSSGSMAESMAQSQNQSNAISQIPLLWAFLPVVAAS